MKQLLLASVLSLTTLATLPAAAATLYTNPPSLGVTDGDCVYNTTCGQLLGNTYAAQKFTLATAATVAQIGYNAFVSGATATGANWIITDALGVGGLPGTTLGSGAGTGLTAVAGPTGAGGTTTDYLFNIAPLALAAGSYYVAIQGVTSTYTDYLSYGMAASGSALSTDGGATWSGSTSYYPTSIAVSLYSTAVPEPASMALLGAGLLGLGLSRRRRG